MSAVSPPTPPPPAAAPAHAHPSPRSKTQHKHFNTLLNDLQAASSQPSHPSSPLNYTHKRLVDSFYVPDGAGPERDKVRVTRDEKTGSVLDCMRKVRLGDLNVYSPKRAADWRISVNLEIPGISSLFFSLLVCVS
jgi:polynucleotide 5'-triphosphatase